MATVVSSEGMAQRGSTAPLLLAGPSSSLVTDLLFISSFQGPLLSALMTWQLASHRLSSQRQPKRVCASTKEATLDHLVSEVIYHQFCQILLVMKTNTRNMWMGTMQGVNNRKGGIIGGYFGC